MRSPPSSSAISGVAGSSESRVNPGMFVGFGMLVVGLLIGLGGILLLARSTAGTPIRRRAVVVIALGLGMVWIGGFVGAFSSLGTPA